MPDEKAIREFEALRGLLPGDVLEPDAPADAEVLEPGDPLPAFRAPLPQEPVAYGQLAFGEPLPAGEWIMAPQAPFRASHLLTWLAEGHAGAELLSLRLGCEEQLAPAALDDLQRQIDGSDTTAEVHGVSAAAFLSRVGIDSFVGHFLRCGGDGSCVYCQALQRRPPVLELFRAQLQRMPAAGYIDLRALSVGERISFRHGVLQGFLFLGWELVER